MYIRNEPIWYFGKICSPQAEVLLLRALNPNHPTPSTLHPIEVLLFRPDSIRLNTWYVVVTSRLYSSQLSENAWVQNQVSTLCTAFKKFYFNSYVSMFPSNLSTIFIKSLTEILDIPSGPKYCIKQKKPTSNWHQIALFERLMYFLLKLPYSFEIHRTIMEIL